MHPYCTLWCYLIINITSTRELSSQNAIKNDVMIVSMPTDLLITRVTAVRHVDKLRQLL
jgi:hypothetical protein